MHVVGMPAGRVVAAPRVVVAVPAAAVVGPDLAEPDDVHDAEPVGVGEDAFLEGDTVLAMFGLAALDQARADLDIA